MSQDKSKSLFSDSYQKFDGEKQKRKKARIRLDLACLAFLKGSTKPIDANLVDIGTGGCMFQCPGSFYQGDAVVIEFKLKGQNLKFTGHIVRSVGKNISMSFDHSNDAAIEKIQEYIHTAYFDKSKK